MKSDEEKAPKKTFKMIAQRVSEKVQSENGVKEEGKGTLLPRPSGDDRVNAMESLSHVHSATHSVSDGLGGKEGGREVSGQVGSGGEMEVRSSGGEMEGGGFHAASPATAKSPLPGGGGGLDSARNRRGSRIMFPHQTHQTRLRRHATMQTDPLTTASLYLFAPENAFRVRVKEMTEHRHFDNVIILVIFLSCITSAMRDPTAPDDEGLNGLLTDIDWAILMIFTVEMLLKIVSLGLILDECSYLRDPWNVFDALIVIISWVTDTGLASGSSTKSLRIFRAFKSLRLVKRLDQLKLLVETLISSFPALSNVLLILFFYLLFMGMVGVQWFKGKFHYVCRDKEISRAYRCNTGLPTAYHCNEEEEVCVYTDTNPNRDVTSFDNIGDAVLTVFVAMSLEGWSDLMYDLMDTSGTVSIIYILIVVLVGNFAIMNLALAVIFDNYQEAKANMLENQSRRQLEHENLMRELAEEEAKWKANKSNEEQVMAKARMRLHLEDVHCEQLQVQKTLKEKVTHKTKKKLTWMQYKLGLKRADAKWDSGSPQDSPRKGGAPGSPSDQTMEEGRKKRVSYLLPEDEIPKSLFAECTPAPLKRLREEWLQPVVQHPLYTFLVMLVVFFNVIILCCEYYMMPAEDRSVLENLNSLATYIFGIEVIFHMTALGLHQYLRDPMNVFDAVISLVSILEMFLLSSEDGGAGVSAFRALRIMRIFKLAKSWKSLQHFLKASMYAAKSAAWMTVLMLLFMFVFSIMGMEMLAGKMDNGQPGDRPYYDNIFWSFVTTFQIISGENWNDVMYRAVEAGGWQMVLYMVGVFMVGNLLLMNLFIAILIDAFVQRQQNDGEGENAEEEKAVKKQWNLLTSFGCLSCVSSCHDRWKSLQTKRRAFFMTGRFEKKALLLFPEGSAIRRGCSYIANAAWFDNIITFIIVSSTMTLIFDTYYEDNEILNYLSTFFALAFFFEMLTKVISMGLYYEENAYLHDSWNVLDGMTTIMSLVSFQFPGLLWARALRAIRPMRIINRIESFRMVTSSVVKAISESYTIAIMAFLLWLVLSVFGMQLFMGAFYICVVDGFIVDVDHRDDCTGVNEKGLEYSWEPIAEHDGLRQNYDNIFNAMLTTFEVATLEMWPDIMYVGVDSSGMDLALVKFSETRPEFALYFILVVLVFGFFIINLFVGIVLDTFNTFKMDMEDRDWAPSFAGENWLDIEKDLAQMKPQAAIPCPENDFRALLYRMVTSSYFEGFINFFIVCTFVVSCLEHYQQPDIYAVINNVYMMLVNLLFAMELLVKIGGLGWHYFSSNWNRFDFVTVLLTMIYSGSRFTSMRMLRFVRIFRVLSSNKGFRTLTQALVKSIPGLMQAGGVLTLVLLIYSIAGVFFFKDVVHQEQINRHANFSNFGFAFLTLFRCATGESYNAIMHELMVKEPLCDSEAGNCGTIIAVPFMLSFTLLVQMILLNLFIALVLSSYTDVSMAENRTINRGDLDRFRDTWMKYDPSAIGWIHVSLLSDLLYDLPEPYGLKVLRSGVKRKSVSNLMDMLRHLRLNMTKEYVDFSHVLYRVMALAFLKTLHTPMSEEEQSWLIGRVNYKLNTEQKRFERMKNIASRVLAALGFVEWANRMVRSDQDSTLQDFTPTPKAANAGGTLEIDQLRTLLQFSSFRKRMSDKAAKKIAKKTERMVSSNYYGPNPTASNLVAVEHYYAMKIIAKVLQQSSIKKRFHTLAEKRFGHSSSILRVSTVALNRNHPHLEVESIAKFVESNSKMSLQKMAKSQYQRLFEQHVHVQASKGVVNFDAYEIVQDYADGDSSEATPNEVDEKGRPLKSSKYRDSSN